MEQGIEWGLLGINQETGDKVPSKCCMVWFGGYHSGIRRGGFHKDINPKPSVRLTACCYVCVCVC